jgi:hypothetical protein
MIGNGWISYRVRPQRIGTSWGDYRLWLVRDGKLFGAFYGRGLPNDPGVHAFLKELDADVSWLEQIKHKRLQTPDRLKRARTRKRVSRLKDFLGPQWRELLRDWVK